MLKEASPILISFKCHHHPQASLNCCLYCCLKPVCIHGGKNWFEKINMLRKPNIEIQSR